ncbi:MAG: hypothetical protein ACLPVY_21850 [Acidimicrobiia bacterium]
MNEFVEECRREWARLHVPDPIANEMAADLEADLKEAEAEGASPEEVLGSGAFDPRSFAASWAAERGVAQPPEPPQTQPLPPPTTTTTTRPRRHLGVLAVLAGSVAAGVVVFIGAALVVGGVRSSRAVAGPVIGPVPFPPFPRMRVGPVTVRVASQGPIGAIGVLILAVLLVGIIGLTLTVAFWRPWNNGGRWSHPHHDQTPEGHYS